LAISLATDGFSAMINAFAMATTGWIYQPRTITFKTSFPSEGTWRKTFAKSKP